MVSGREYRWDLQKHWMKRRIPLRTFQLATKTLIAGPRCDNPPYDTKYETVKNYWQSRARFLIPGLDHRKHLLTKGVGIAALAIWAGMSSRNVLPRTNTSVEAMAQHAAAN